MDEGCAWPGGNRRLKPLHGGFVALFPEEGAADPEGGIIVQRIQWTRPDARPETIDSLVVLAVVETVPALKIVGLV